MTPTTTEVRVYPEDPQYEPMFSMWEEQHHPGWIDFGNALWKVSQRHEDNAVIFICQGGPEDFYTSRSTKGITK